MAMINVKCPQCGSIKVVKHGKTETGYQRYYCNNKECTTKSFQLEYSYNGCRPGIDNQIIAMATNASGIRDTSRVLKISTDKVMSTLKKQKVRFQM